MVDKLAARIPPAKEVAEWEAMYTKQYARDHQGPRIYLTDAQAKHLDSVIKGADPRKPDHQRCAWERGKGFQARRNNLPATDNPHVDKSDEYYCWYLGWQQGQPKTRNLV